MNCPCGSNNFYVQCCERAHKDLSKVTTAEQLMRSRYSAFVLGNGNYLMDSHHSNTRPLKEKKSIESWAKSVSWIRLEILNTEKGGIIDQKGTVTFNAYFFENGKVEVIHEKSGFVKENGLWMYLGLAE
ncbi:Sec-C motif domain protein [Arenibacter sp. F26102]|uniref:YchJ family protein n=1 Tax=Arenibacter sp. F26102 TaxID=2926416 RepID=UPI001FF14C29|nr:YchJ family metal-binding protein [Arenibacter sp. F26102]MCK0144213.1 Sec-C motif domain protein [Arenibacter sp. F26102]